MEKPAGTVRIDTWRGMASLVDPGEIDPGAAELQINFRSQRVGELSTREGLHEMTFDQET